MIEDLKIGTFLNYELWHSRNWNVWEGRRTDGNKTIVTSGDMDALIRKIADEHDLIIYEPIDS